GELGFQMVAGLMLLGEGDPAADLLKLLGQKRAHTVKRCLVIAGGLNLHHALEKGHHLRLALTTKIGVLKDGPARRSACGHSPAMINLSTLQMEDGDDPRDGI